MENAILPQMTLSLAAPAYNEADHIADLVDHWVNYLRTRAFWSAFEIVICNDASRDNTGEVLETLARKYPEVRPVHHARNQGAGAALRTSILSTRYSKVLLIDSDGQFPISNLARFETALLSSRHYALIGTRSAKKDSTFARFGSYASGLVCNRIYRSKLRDFNSALKLVDGPLVRSLHLEARGLNYSTEMTGKLLESGLALEEVEVEHIERVGGKSSRKALRDSWRRLLFVSYLAVRRFLVRSEILFPAFTVDSKSTTSTPGNGS